MKWPKDPDARRRLCEALLDWVAALEEAEPTPAGLDPSIEAEVPDLHTALGEVEALRREIKLQGRTFARLAEASEDVSARVKGLHEAGDEQILADRDAARRDGRREVIEALIETREGLGRSLASAHALEPHLVRGWFGARARGVAAASLVRALAMNLEAADAALRDLDMRELRCEGESFDPRTMRAVEVADASEGAPGTVVAVRRSGWLAGERVLRHAEVRAVPAKTPTTTKETV